MEVLLLNSESMSEASNLKVVLCLTLRFQVSQSPAIHNTSLSTTPMAAAAASQRMCHLVTIAQQRVNIVLWQY